MTKERRMAILVPYRDRAEQLQVFVQSLSEFMSRYVPDADYDIVVIEQDPGAPFNRGWLFNVGFALSEKDYDYFCFHDVDMIPEDSSCDYSYPSRPTHLSTYISRFDYRTDLGDYNILSQNFGGVVLFSKEHFRAVNGYSNEYWGWGLQENDLRLRCEYFGLGVDRRFGRYLHLDHPRFCADFMPPLLVENQRRHLKVWGPDLYPPVESIRIGCALDDPDHPQVDGLASLDYQVLKKETISERAYKYCIAVQGKKPAVDALVVTMPWHQPSSPALVMGSVHNLLLLKGFSSASRSYFLSFAEYLANQMNLTGELFTLDYYQRLIGNHGLGEWAFAVPPFGATNAESDHSYFEYLRSQGLEEELLDDAKKMRDLVPPFLDYCVFDALRLQPKAVLFSPMYRDIVPSLVLAKMLKRERPELKIIFLGPVFDIHNGKGLIRSFDWIDAVVTGDWEKITPQVIEDVLHDREFRAQNGLCYRQNGVPTMVPRSNQDNDTMDHVPIPNFDEYFGRLAGAVIRPAIASDLWLAYRSSRGCWWAEKSRCRFCALTGANASFRKKNPATVVNEIFALASRYRQLRFQIFDWILDSRYFREILPAIRDSGCDLRLGLESRADMDRQDFNLLGSVGAELQIGIESLSTPILHSLAKGTTALKNIRALKWCAEENITVDWNILFDIPGEPREEYARMAALVPALTHLAPPRLNRFRLHPLSRYYQESERLPLTVKGPVPWYQHVYSMLDLSELAEIADEFEFDHEDGRSHKCEYVQPLAQAVDDWIKNSNLTYRRLRYKKGPGFLTIVDERLPDSSVKYTFEDREAVIYLACADGADIHHLLHALSEAGYGSVDRTEVVDFLEMLAHHRLVYRENNTCLSLAIADKVRN